MRPATSWSDLRGARVGLWGVGVEGEANLRKLRTLDIEPVLVGPTEGAAADGTHIVGLDAGDAGTNALTTADYVVKSPGISRYDDLVTQLRASDVPVLGGLGLWLAEATTDRVMCVTGTKGKSTTASIAGALLTGLGYRALIGGNLGTPPWDPLAGDDYDWWVIEVSSYQALDVDAGPAVVVVTSLSQDHLTWHRTADNYFRDKLSLCTRPGVRAVVADGHDPLLREHAALLGDTVEWITDGPGPWATGLELLGAHNARNAAVARAGLVALGVPEAVDDGALTRAASAYRPLPSRLTMLGRVAGVDFVDDSLSTNVLPALAAVAAFDGRRIALLVGGQDRGIDYLPLALGLVGREDMLVLTMPDNGAEIGKVIESVSGTPAVVDCDDVVAATNRAFDWARPDGVVLLSPAAPSFGQFVDYRARARAFESVMRDLSAGTDTPGAASPA